MVAVVHKVRCAQLTSGRVCSSKLIREHGSIGCRGEGTDVPRVRSSPWWTGHAPAARRSSSPPPPPHAAPPAEGSWWRAQQPRQGAAGVRARWRVGPARPRRCGGPLCRTERMCRRHGGGCATTTCRQHCEVIVWTQMCGCGCIIGGININLSPRCAQGDFISCIRITSGLIDRLVVPALPIQFITTWEHVHEEGPTLQVKLRPPEVAVGALKRQRYVLCKIERRLRNSVEALWGYKVQ